MSDNTQAEKYSPPSDELVVTDRGMLTVLKDLSCDTDFFRDKKVLSVGEGLSGFANGLAEKGIDVTAVDPIYENAELLSSAAPKDYESLGKDVSFKSYRVPGEEYNPPNRDKIKIIAASSVALPFKNDEFDVVVANRVYEHVDMSQVLPEMIRVLKDPDGELRLGGVMLHCIPREGKLISGIY